MTKEAIQQQKELKLYMDYEYNYLHSKLRGVIAYAKINSRDGLNNYSLGSLQYASKMLNISDLFITTIDNNSNKLDGIITRRVVMLSCELEILINHITLEFSIRYIKEGAESILDILESLERYSK